MLAALWTSTSPVRALRRPSSLRRLFSSSHSFFVLPSEAYAAKVRAGQVTEDAVQVSALKLLDRLHTELLEAAKEAPPASPAAKPAKTGFFSKWLSSSSSASTAPPRAVPTTPFTNVKGLYLHGGVGCGKSFLMDLFFENVPVAKKKRAHFHRFMQDIHERIHEVKTYRPKASGVDEVAEALTKEFELLCFDEFQVTDIADAMILRRMFTALFERGVVMVSTSNRPPSDLYLGGLNREAFTPFIDLLYQKCVVHDMMADKDYRLTGSTLEGMYFTPLGPESHNKLVEAWKSLSRDAPIEGTTLEVFGRPIEVRLAAAGMAWFTFPDLCMQAMGAADYGVIAKEFHTIFLAGLPRFTPERRNEVKRFIMLVDQLYEHKVKLMCTADAAPNALLDESKKAQELDGHLPLGGEFADAYMLDALGKQGAQSVMSLFTSHEEKFAFARAVSRLQEMQTKEYLQLQHVTKGRPPYVVDL